MLRRHLLCIAALVLFTVLASPSSVAAQDATADQPVDTEGRLELFVDRYLIDKLDGAELRMHRPQKMPLPKSPLPIAYATVIKDGDLYRAYYRDYVPGYEGPYDDGNAGEITCYAESRDGHEWSFPDLDVTTVRSSRGGNVILSGASPCSHNFAPFLDVCPRAAKDARFKALAGTHTSGLIAFKSADGIHWQKIREEPVLTSKPFAFDSQNVSFWSFAEECYVCYFRSWQTPHGKLRTISRTTSRDFVSWSEPVPTNPNVKGEHLYTSQTHPYFRASHIYIALPTRFFPDRGESTDVLFMATRAGSDKFERLFTEAYIRPGLDPARWGNRSNYVARCVVPTGPAEMSIYHSSGHRYVLRTDGFVSVGAGVGQGEMVTKPLWFMGNVLIVNYSTSGAGSLRVELQKADGTPLPGFALDDCPPIVGDEIEHAVAWNGDPDLGVWAGKPVRVRFVMAECDVYSLRFVGR